ncbi:MAG: hypothetical protein OSA98_12450 [Rubripirellula sp.]|nr:hypothetical protein [Rubripirellula sp.]
MSKHLAAAEKRLGCQINADALGVIPQEHCAVRFRRNTVRFDSAGTIPQERFRRNTVRFAQAGADQTT